jgi:hypothetical protein
MDQAPRLLRTPPDARGARAKGQTMSERAEFSVWVFLPDDWHFPLAQFIDAKRAVEVAALASRRDDAVRVIITDGGDHTCFEWIRGKGVTFG